jgi:hypothetical protein
MTRFLPRAAPEGLKTVSPFARALRAALFHPRGGCFLPCRLVGFSRGLGELCLFQTFMLGLSIPILEMRASTHRHFPLVISLPLAVKLATVLLASPAFFTLENN